MIVVKDNLSISKLDFFCISKYQISVNLKYTWDPIFLKIVRYDPDTNTDTDIITTLGGSKMYYVICNIQ